MKESEKHYMVWSSTRLALLASLTKLMCHSEGCLQSVIFNNGTASLWVTHSAHIGHAKSVTGVGATQILESAKETKRTL